MVETFMLMGSPLLLIEEKGERKMVALDPEYDTPKEDLDRDIQKTYLENVKLFALSKEAQPCVAKFKFTRGNNKETFGEQSYSWILFKGITRIEQVMKYSVMTQEDVVSLKELANNGMPRAELNYGIFKLAIDRNEAKGRLSLQRCRKHCNNVLGSK
jgi:hypothetical protein